MSDVEIDAQAFIRALSHRLGEVTAEVELTKMMNSSLTSRLEEALALVASQSNLVRSLEGQVESLGATPITQS